MLGHWRHVRYSRCRSDQRAQLASVRRVATYVGSGCEEDRPSSQPLGGRAGKLVLEWLEPVTDHARAHMARHATLGGSS